MSSTPTMVCVSPIRIVGWRTRSRLPRVISYNGRTPLRSHCSRPYRSDRGSARASKHSGITSEWACRARKAATIFSCGTTVVRIRACCTSPIHSMLRRACCSTRMRRAMTRRLPSRVLSPLPMANCLRIHSPMAARIGRSGSFGASPMASIYPMNYVRRNFGN